MHKRGRKLNKKIFITNAQNPECIQQKKAGSWLNGCGSATMKEISNKFNSLGTAQYKSAFSSINNITFAFKLWKKEGRNQYKFPRSPRPTTYVCRLAALQNDKRPFSREIYGAALLAARQIPAGIPFLLNTEHPPPPRSAGPRHDRKCLWMMMHGMDIG